MGKILWRFVILAALHANLAHAGKLLNLINEKNYSVAKVETEKRLRSFFKNIDHTIPVQIAQCAIFSSDEKEELLDSLNFCSNHARQKLEFYLQKIEDPDNPESTIFNRFIELKNLLQENVFSKIDDTGQLEMDVIKALKRDTLQLLITYVDATQSYHKHRSTIYNILLGKNTSTDPLIAIILENLDNRRLTEKLSVASQILTYKLLSVINFTLQVDTKTGSRVQITIFDDDFNPANKAVTIRTSSSLSTNPDAHGALMTAFFCYSYEHPANKNEFYSGGLAPTAEVTAYDLDALHYELVTDELKGVDKPNIINLSIGSRTPSIIKMTRSQFYELAGISLPLTSTNSEDLQYYCDPRDKNNFDRCQVIKKFCADEKRCAHDWFHNDWTITNPIPDNVVEEVFIPVIEGLWQSDAEIYRSLLTEKTLIIKAAGNYGVVLSKTGYEVSHDGIYDDPEVLQHTIFAVCADFINYRLASYSNQAGEHWQDTLTIPAHYVMLRQPDGSYYMPLKGGGTSGAAAVLSAVAATLYSHFPTLNYADIKYALLEGAKFRFKSYTPEKYGRGLLNYKRSYALCQSLLEYRQHTDQGYPPLNIQSILAVPPKKNNEALNFRTPSVPHRKRPLPDPPLPKDSGLETDFNKLKKYFEPTYN